MDGKINIIRLFCRDLTKEITIRQISKLIKKSYAYTNKEVWDLINKEVLNKKEIGKSIICSLNINNELTKALLAFNSFLEKQEYLQNKSRLKQEIERLIKDQKEVYTIFLSNKKLFIVCYDKSLLKNLKAKILTKQEFDSSLKNIGLDNLIVYGFEKYWEFVGDIYG